MIFGRVIAVLQIVGASTAFVFMLTLMLESAQGVFTYLILLVMYAFFAVVFVSGIWLWNGEPRGYRYSMIVQAAQIPVLTSGIMMQF